MLTLITLPTELICQIAFHIEDYADLLSFALTTHLLHDIVNPYIDYLSISCTLNDPRRYQNVWEHLSGSSLLSSTKQLVANLSLFESSSRYIDSRSASPIYEQRRSTTDRVIRDNSKIIRIPKACKSIRSVTKTRESTRNAHSDSVPIDHIQNALNTIHHLPNLVSFEVQLYSDKYLSQIVEGLVETQPILKRMTVVYNVDRRDLSQKLPTSLFLDLDYTHLTNLIIRSNLSIFQKTDLTTMLISRTPNLTNLALHLPFNIFGVLKHSTWPNLLHLELGCEVELFLNPATEPDTLDLTAAADLESLSTDSGKRTFFTSFLRRHPSLEHLYLPVWTQLATCFPAEEGLCSNVRVLQTTPETLGHRLVPLHIPASLARQLTHFSTRFHGDIVQTISAMSNLDSCTLVMHMDQAKYIETVLRSAPKITKLRIELLGEGMKLLSWIENTVKVLLFHSPHLTQLLSLFDDLDVGQPIAKKLIHQLVTQVPTLKYTTGSIDGKRFLLRFDRGGTTTYTVFKTTVMKGLPALPSPNKNIVDLDDNLTSWGNFWG